MSAGATAHICKATPVPWFVLVHAKHGRTAHDRHMYNSGLPRMLNVNGRWSSHATREVPVLVWHDQAAAAEALAVCQEHRGGGLIVSNFWNSDIELGREVVLFAPGHGPALRGYVSTDASAAAKAEAARLKALASAAFLVGRATGDARLVLRARLLSPKAGSGAAYFLTGKAGSALAASIIDGSVAADTEVTAEVVAVGVDIARRVMVERDCLDGGSHSERPFR